MRQLFLVPLLTLWGCAHDHVVLEALPRADAPREVRLAAYLALRPVGGGLDSSEGGQSVRQLPHVRHTHYGSVVDNRPGDPGGPYVDLGNGMRVRHGEDLLPVVPEQSDVAVLALKEQQDEKVVRFAGEVGVGASLVAATAFALGIMLGHPLTFSGDSDALRTPIWGTAGVGLAVGAVAGFVTAWYEKRAGETRLSLFHSYNRTLREALGLRAEDLGPELAQGSAP